MKAALSGVLVSLLFHGLLGGVLLLVEKSSVNRGKKFKLDIYFSYDYVPKGNSLDASLLNMEQEKKMVKEKKNSLTSKKPRYADRDRGEKKYGVEEGADSIYIKENLGTIQARIRNRIIYPAIARRMGWTGRVHITFNLSKEGEVSGVKVVKSSGYPVLDKCAVKAVMSLSGLPKPPMLTRVNVPFSFSLQ